MANFEAWVDVDPDDYWREMSKREKKEMIGILVEEASEDNDLMDSLKENLSEYSKGKAALIFSSDASYDQIDFEKSLAALQGAYYSLSKEKIDQINEIAKLYK
jgi:hypothetical protein